MIGRLAMKLENRLALITGGGRGIGRAIAIAFAREGASIAVAARTRAQVESVADEVACEFGVETLAIECDVADAESVNRAFTHASEQFGGGPDILVNNAGIAETSPFTKTDEEMWQRHLEVHLTGTFRCTSLALPGMIERGWGRVINIASIAGKTGKSAADALAVLKRASPQNRLVTAEEVAALALLLASEEGRGINGQAINVDGGTVLF